MATPAPAALGQSFDQLSRRHGIKVVPAFNCSVEDCALAVGKAVGYDSIVSASRMNGAVVIFLDVIEKVNSVVQSGVVIQDTLVSVVPLIQPAKRIILSNVPPFIKDELLVAELSRHGKIMSQMKKIPLGCKSPLLKHVVCFRRQVYMVLNKAEDEMNMAFKFRIDGFDYVIFASSDTMKCFACGMEGHTKRACPARIEGAEAGVLVNENAGSSNVEQTSVDNATMNVRKQREDGENSKSVDVSGVEDMDVVVGDIENEDESETNVTTETVIAVAECILAEENKNTEFEKDEALFKAPSSKRKRARKSPRKKSDEMVMDKQAGKSDETENSAVDDSDSEAVDDNNEKVQPSYTFAKVRNFLQKTKNMKNVQVVDYFQDRKAFIESVVMLMRGEGEEQFTVQEIYRLKKFVSKVKLELKNEDGFETT